MKKYLLFGLIIFCLFNINVNASTNTMQRTEDNLLLPSWVDVSKVDKNIVLNTYAVNSSEKIYDFANYLSEEEEVNLYTYANEYISQTGYDIVILTVDNLGNLNPYDYMYSFYDYNSFDRNGIIMLVYKNGDNDDVYIGTTKYGEDSKIEDIYTKEYIKATIDYLRGRFKENKDYDGFYNFIKLGIGIYNIQTDSGDYVVNADGELVKNIYWLDYLVISIAITSIAIVVLVYINGINNKKVINKDYLNKTTLVVKKVSEEIIEKPEK